MTEVAKFLVDHPETGLILLGIGALVVWGFGKMKAVTGVVLIVVGLGWYTYRAWEARIEPITVTQPRISTFRNGHLQHNVTIAGKTRIMVDFEPFEQGQVTSIRYDCREGACGWTYPCDRNDKDNCDALRNQRHEPLIPYPDLRTCRGHWEAIGNGDDSVMLFDLTFKRMMKDGDSQFTEWKQKFPLVWRLINLSPVRQPC